MRRALAAAAVAEMATGVALVVAPSLVGRLLIGADFTDLAIVAARVAGIALVGLGVACWPGPPRAGMALYGALVGLYLAWLGATDAAAGILLWPAVVLHVALSAAMVVGPRARKLPRADL